MKCLHSIAVRLINRETVSYVIFGVLTSIINIGVFELFLISGIDYRIANLVALLITKLCAYIVNKLFVFRTRVHGFAALIKEISLFVLARGGTMVVDWTGLVILVSVLGLSEHIGKIITTIVVVLLNYVLGKYLVFRKDPANGN